MKAGKLRYVAELLKPAATGDAYSTGTGFTSVGTARVDLAPLNGSEIHSAHQTQGKLVARVWMRYRADIKASWRLVVDGNTWEIASPPMDKKGHKTQLEMLVYLIDG